MNDAPESVSRAPITVKIMLIVLTLEALLAAAIGVWVAVEAFSEEGSHILGTAFLAAVCLGLAAFLFAAVRAMAKHRAWSRGAALAWQVLQMGIALGTFNGGQGVVWLAVALFVPVLVVLLCVFRQSVTDWLAREEAA